MTASEAGGAGTVCVLCGTRAEGRPVLVGVTDLKYGVKGTWAFRRCPACGLVALHPPRPAGGDGGYGYPQQYRQHASPGPAEPVPGRTGVRRYARRRALAGLGYAETGVASGAPSPVDRAFARVPAVRVGAQWGCLLVPPARPGGRLLDVGCGNGRFLGLMRALGWEVAGVEPDEQSAAVAAERGLEVVATVEQVRRPTDGFDVVTMNHVVEHFDDPVADLGKVRQLCSPDGRLGIATPNWDAVTRKWFGRHWYALEPPRHVALFTPRTLRATVERAGLRVVSSNTRAVREGTVAWRLGSTWRYGRPWPRWALGAGTTMSLAAALVGGGEEIELWASIS